MIRVDAVGELRGMARAELPSRGIVLDADTISLRGFGLLYQKVDLLPAGEIERAARAHCQCEHRNQCGACKVLERVRRAGMVEGSP